MEMNNTIEYSEKQEKIGSVICERVNNFFKGIYENFDKSKVTKIAKIGDEDRRRIMHSVKVGLAITLVSFLYYLRPLYDGLFGQAGMSAVLTVVVVFEFSSVGALFSKCLNSGAATLVAGGLGVGAGYLARLCGDKGEAIVLGILVFLLGTCSINASTYMRFIPSIKNKYDHGVVIFILTFTLVAILSYRVTEISILGHQRLSTIFMGGAICILVSVSVCPVWAGQDLHLLVSGNIDKLATFFLGYGGDISIDKIDKLYLESHKTVLDSKATEESLANFAWWEPPHGGFRYNHPWKHYLEIGVLTRECANHIQTLISTGYCINSKPRESESEFDLKIEPACKKLSTELGKALKEIASATKEMTLPQLSAAQIHISNSKSADELKIVLENCSSLLLTPTKIDLGRIMPPLVTTSILVDVIECIERISVSVDELSQKALFRKLDSSKDHKKLDDLHVVIDIKDELDAKQETL